MSENKQIMALFSSSSKNFHHITSNVWTYAWIVKHILITKLIA